MNTQAQLEFTALLLGINTGLVGLAATLVTLIPVLFELARSKNVDFYTNINSTNKLKKYLTYLKYAIILFVIVIISLGLEYFIQINILFYINIFLSLLPFLIVAYVSIAISSLIIDVLYKKDEK